METALEVALQEAWGSGRAASQLTATAVERLASGEYKLLDTAQRLRLVLALGMLRRRALASMSDSVRSLLALAADDIEEWIRQLAGMLSAALPDVHSGSASHATPHPSRGTTRLAPALADRLIQAGETPQELLEVLKAQWEKRGPREAALADASIPAHRPSLSFDFDLAGYWAQLEGEGERTATGEMKRGGRASIPEPRRRSVALVADAASPYAGASVASSYAASSSLTHGLEGGSSQAHHVSASSLAILRPGRRGPREADGDSGLGGLGIGRLDASSVRGSGARSESQMTKRIDLATLRHIQQQNHALIEKSRMAHGRGYGPHSAASSSPHPPKDDGKKESKESASKKSELPPRVAEASDEDGELDGGGERPDAAEDDAPTGKTPPKKRRRRVNEVATAAKAAAAVAAAAAKAAAKAAARPGPLPAVRDKEGGEEGELEEVDAEQPSTGGEIASAAAVGGPPGGHATTVAATSSSTEEQKILAQAPHLPKEDRELVRMFFSPNRNELASRGTVRINLAEIDVEATDPNALPIKEFLVFEMNFENGSWRKLRRRQIMNPL